MSGGQANRISPWKLGGLSVKQLGVRVWEQINNDDVLGRSAELAYYFFLALFPAMIFLTAIVGVVAGPGTALHENLMSNISRALPPSTAPMVSKVLREALSTSGGGKLTFGIVFALWTASGGISAIMDTLNIAYGVRETRSYLKRKWMSIWLTVVTGILVIVAIGIVTYGGTGANFVSSHLGMGTPLTLGWKIIQWPVALFFMSLVFALLYYFGPNLKEVHWEWVTPGSVLGVVLWLAASFGLRAYLHYFNNYNATYGSLGAVIILLLWFYITGAVILIGGEINSEIENAAAERGHPEAKEEGELEPGGERKPLREEPVRTSSQPTPKRPAA